MAILVSGLYTPMSTGMTYALMGAEHMNDGLRNVNTLSDMYNIYLPRRKQGMIVGVNTDSSYWRLKEDVGSIGTSTDWEPFANAISNTAQTFLDLVDVDIDTYVYGYIPFEHSTGMTHQSGLTFSGNTLHVGGWFKVDKGTSIDEIVTIVDSSSTDVQLPTARAVYQADILAIESAVTFATSGLTNTFIDLTDTITGYTANRILYESSNEVIDSSDFTFDGTELSVGGSVLISSGITLSNNHFVNEVVTLVDINSTNEQLPTAAAVYTYGVLVSGQTLLEADDRYVDADGDSMTGDLTMIGTSIYIGSGLTFSTGPFVNEIVTLVHSASTDSQLPTAEAVWEAVTEYDTFLELEDTITGYTANRILFESGTTVVDSSKFTYDVTNNNFLVGTLNGTTTTTYYTAIGKNITIGQYAIGLGYQVEASGELSVAIGNNSKALGDNSFAFGIYSEATSNYAFAMGNNVSAFGNNSFATGYFTKAYGVYAHTEGSFTTAVGDSSHAEGNETSAFGIASHAEGDGTLANGYNSHAEGSGTTALGAAHSEGEQTTASGHTSHAEGYKTKASGDYSHSEGYFTTTEGEAAHSEGTVTRASGDYSHAEGHETNATGNMSHTEGWNTNAIGLISHAEGASTGAHGDYSHSEGLSAFSYGIASHSEGNETVANGYSSHAEGHHTRASGISSHAQNLYTIANGFAQTTIGAYNIENGDSSPFINNVDKSEYVFIIGNGTNDLYRSNAFAVDWSGNTFMSLGFMIEASGTSSTNINHAYINELSDDETLSDGSHNALVTEYAIKQYVGTAVISGITANSATTFHELTDTINSYTANRILFESSNEVIDSSNLTFDGTNLSVGGSVLISSGLTLSVGPFVDEIVTLIDINSTDEQLPTAKAVWNSDLWVLNSAITYLNNSNTFIDLSDVDIDSYQDGYVPFEHSSGMTHSSNLRIDNDEFIIGYDTLIRGNLYVSGTTTTINTKDLTIFDNIITINSGETTGAVLKRFAGLKIDRGISNPYFLVFDEDYDYLKVGFETETNLASAKLRRIPEMVTDIEPSNGTILFYSGNTKHFNWDNTYYYDNDTNLLNVDNLNISTEFTLNSDTVDEITLIINASSTDEQLPTAAAVYTYGVLVSGQTLLEADDRYVDADGDSMTGDLTMIDSSIYIGSGLTFSAGPFVNEIVTLVHSASTDSQLPTAEAVWEALTAYDTFLELEDTITGYTANRILFESGTTVVDSSKFTYDVTNNNFLVGTLSGTTTNTNYVAIGEEVVIGGDYAYGLGYQVEASGDYSYAEGSGTTASGLVSHAEGFHSVASGNYSHAEGLLSTASGDLSHAEAHSFATGNMSHAEGDSYAVGAYSHAEGSSRPSGEYSHAEGISTTTSTHAIASHVEGISTSALSGATHAEGFSTKAIGHISHAEGHGSKSEGTTSHAEGYYTTAEGIYSHSEGFHSVASGNYSHAEGSSNNATGIASHTEGSSNNATGSASHAEGGVTIAFGSESHSEGYSTYAGGISSHAEGFFSFTDILAWYSHAEGYYTTALGTANHVEGYETYTSGNYSHAEGYYSTNFGLGSHVENVGNLASGHSSHVDGFMSTSTGFAQHVLGTFNEISGYNPQPPVGFTESGITFWSDIIDENVFIIGGGSAETYRTNAMTVSFRGNMTLKSGITLGVGEYVSEISDDETLADASHSTLVTEWAIKNYIGTAVISGITANSATTFLELTDTINSYNEHRILVESSTEVVDSSKFTYDVTNNNFLVGTATTGTYSDWVAIGKDVVIGANYAYALGTEVEASGHFSFAEGYGSIASGNQSHAEGLGSIANGDSSHAEGESSVAEGDISHAEGFETKANANYSHSEGRKTTANGIYSHVGGYMSVAGNHYSIAHGHTTITAAWASVAFNYQTVASGLCSTVIGAFNEINGANTSAIGTLDRDEYVFIIGNGVSEGTRSNALEVSWKGNLFLASGLTLGTNSNYVDEITTTVDAGSTHSQLPTAAAVWDAVSSFSSVDIESGTTDGQMLFWDNINSTWIHSETSELYWDDTNKQLGILTDSPSYDLEVNGSFGAITKSFIIKHPTKEGKKLEHGSLEGPEYGVYYRGKLSDGKNVIEIPDYWLGLVDENTITVDLTPIGKYQKLYVKSISKDFITIGTGTFNGNVNCFYTVYGERKDVKKLIVEK